MTTDETREKSRIGAADGETSAAAQADKKRLRRAAKRGIHVSKESPGKYRVIEMNAGETYAVTLHPPHCNCHMFSSDWQCMHYRLAEITPDAQAEATSFLSYGSGPVDPGGKRRAAMSKAGFGPLPPEAKKHEKEELRFQRAVNEAKYLTWERMRGFIELDGRYEISTAGGRKMYGGRDLLEKARKWIQNVSSTRVACIRKLAGKESVSKKDMWVMSRKRGQGGKKMVNGHEDDVWGIAWFGKSVSDAVLERFCPDDHLLDAALEVMLEKRRAVRRFDNKEALNAALSDARTVMRQCYANETSEGRPADAAIQLMMGQGRETLDRIYGLERIRLAGIDIERHKEFKSYQAFYDRNMAPPTHEEMADYIIGLLGSGSRKA